MLQYRQPAPENPEDTYPIDWDIYPHNKLADLNAHRNQCIKNPPEMKQTVAAANSSSFTPEAAQNIITQVVEAPKPLPSADEPPKPQPQERQPIEEEHRSVSQVGSIREYHASKAGSAKFHRSASQATSIRGHQSISGYESVKSTGKVSAAHCENQAAGSRIPVRKFRNRDLDPSLPRSSPRGSLTKRNRSIAETVCRSGQSPNAKRHSSIPPLIENDEEWLQDQCQKCPRDLTDPEDRNEFYRKYAKKWEELLENCEGISKNQKAIETCRRRYKRATLDFYNHSLEHFPPKCPTDEEVRWRIDAKARKLDHAQHEANMRDEIAKGLSNDISRIEAEIDKERLYNASFDEIQAEMNAPLSDERFKSRTIWNIKQREQASIHVVAWCRETSRLSKLPQPRRQNISAC